MKAIGLCIFSLIFSILSFAFTCALLLQNINQQNDIIQLEINNSVQRDQIIQENAEIKKLERLIQQDIYLLDNRNE